MSAGHSGAVCVVLLMTSNALQRWNALAVRAAHNIGEVPVPVVALLRIVRRRVAVDAARMREHRIDLLPCGQAVRSHGRLRRRALLAFWRRIGCASDNRRESAKQKNHSMETHCAGFPCGS